MVKFTESIFASVFRTETHGKDLPNQLVMPNLVSDLIYFQKYLVYTSTVPSHKNAIVRTSGLQEMMATFVTNILTKSIYALNSFFRSLPHTSGTDPSTSTQTQEMYKT